MKKFIIFIFGFVLVCFILFISVIVSAGNDTMEVEADIFSQEEEDSISIEVPNYLYFGEVEFEKKSIEYKIYVNNTGTTDIAIRPELVGNDEIFENLYLRKYKTSQGEDVPYEEIGDFWFNISKPISGEDYNEGYFYIILDLTNYNGDKSEDLLGRKANVKFSAVAI